MPKARAPTPTARNSLLYLGASVCGGGRFPTSTASVTRKLERIPLIFTLFIRKWLTQLPTVGGLDHCPNLSQLRPAPALYGHRCSEFNGPLSGYPTF
jgi:hypothetical protein